MSLHHDLAWWGVVLATLGIILIVPLGFLTNIITPKIQNWWSQRSQASLITRIETLQAKLEGFEKLQPLSDTEDTSLLGIETILWVLSLMPSVTTVMVGSIGFGVGWTRAIGVVVDLLWALWVLTSAYKIAQFREPRSPATRRDLKRQIDSLIVKLGKK